MKKNLRLLISAALGALIALGSTSCYYDPAYSTTSVGGSYSSGAYGDGYGYGGSSFSTSVFVSTGDPRWGYDPYCYSYYDYSSRRYYDPYLNGYYPIGYRPPVVYGVPHPGGWRPGHGYCPPPRYVSRGYVSDYRNREGRYRNSDYRWAKQVHQRPEGNHVQGQRPQGGNRYQQNDRQSDTRPNNYNRPSGNSSRPSSSRPSTSSRPSGGSSREEQTRGQSNPYTQKNYRPQTGNRTPERYSSPVYSQQQRPSQGQRPSSQGYGGQRPSQAQRPAPQNYGGQRQQGQRPQPQNTRGSGKKQSEDAGRVQGYR
jgi:hypothetical protein